MIFFEIEPGQALTVPDLAPYELGCKTSVDCVSTHNFNVFTDEANYRTVAEDIGEPTFKNNYLTDSLRVTMNDDEIPAFCLTPRDAIAFCNYRGLRLLSVEEWLRLAHWYCHIDAAIRDASGVLLRNDEFAYDQISSRICCMNAPDYETLLLDELEECCEPLKDSQYDTTHCFRVTPKSGN